MVMEMQDNSDRYGGGGYAGRQQMICGTMEMLKWVVRMETDCANINREGLPT